MESKIPQKNIIELIPRELHKILSFDEIENVSFGWTNSIVLKFLRGYKNKNVYLKILKKNPAEKLETEADILKWLRKKIPFIPELIFYKSQNGYEFMLISEIQGIPAHDKRILSSPEILIPEMAKALKMIHSLNIQRCRFDQRSDAKLKKAKKNVERSAVKQEQFHAEYPDKTPEDIYNLCVKDRPLEDTLVFTHGDFCLPNIYI